MALARQPAPAAFQNTKRHRAVGLAHPPWIQLSAVQPGFVKPGCLPQCQPNPQQSPYLPQQSPCVPQQSPYLPQQSPYLPQQSPYLPQQSPYVPQQSPYLPQQSPYLPQQTPYLPHETFYIAQQSSYVPPAVALRAPGSGRGTASGLVLYISLKSK
ncbi:unnamed protein product [Boreogadus saida]